MTDHAIGRASPIVVAIPARDEADRIGICLRALEAQRRQPDVVVLFVNNGSDATEQIARAATRSYRLDIVARDLPRELASAGHARRLAMQIAADHAGPNGILLTTDADGIVADDWIERNAAAVKRGADVVCGRAIIDPQEAAMIPAHLHQDDAREQRLIELIDSLAWSLDPEPHDPPPRHTEASGASIAVTAAAFHRVGGIPAIRSGEDRAFVRALWMLDARVRHDPTIQVTVSGRIIGRAEGGMADTICRRIIQQDEFADDQVEPAAEAYRRYALRSRVRRAWANGLASPALCRDLGVGAVAMVDALVTPHFGETWAVLEAVSPVLRRRRVRFSELTREISTAETLLQRLSMPETLAAD